MILVVQKFLNYLGGVKLSTTYKILRGDTFETIARKSYGIDTEAGRISAANPGVTVLIPGREIVIPDLPGENPPIGQVPANDPDETVVLIGGSRFRFWTSIRFNRELDTISSVDITAPFEHDAPGFRATFRPFAFSRVAITIGGAIVFTGTIINITPVVTSDKREISINAYSLPGILMDCTPPSSSFPLEFDNVGLRNITTYLLKPFGISATFSGSMGAVFERVVCEPEKRVFEFLVNLVQQRNLILTDNAQGGLLFTRAVTAGNPVAILKQGESPLLSVIPQFSPQNYYSHITGLSAGVAGLSGSKYTYKNPALPGVLRPYVFNIPDTLDSDARAAVEAKAGRMVGEMASYTIEVATWRTPAGALWAPNTTIKLLAPDAMIYNTYEFIIRSVVLERVADSAKASLNLVIPGAFSGGIPEAMPWDL